MGRGIFLVGKAKLNKEQNNINTGKLNRIFEKNSIAWRNEPPNKIE
jgi:hypothetical protein